MEIRYTVVMTGVRPGRPIGDFKEGKALLLGALSNWESPVRLTDAEIAKVLMKSERQIRRYLALLKTEGLIDITTHRWKFNDTSWKNHRSIFVKDINGIR